MSYVSDEEIRWLSLHIIAATLQQPMLFYLLKRIEFFTGPISLDNHNHSQFGLP